jgi:hypothetical protein
MSNGFSSAHGARPKLYNPDSLEAKNHRLTMSV